MLCARLYLLCARLALGPCLNAAAVEQDLCASARDCLLSAMSSSAYARERVLDSLLDLSADLAPIPATKGPDPWLYRTGARADLSSTGKQQVPERVPLWEQGEGADLSDCEDFDEMQQQNAEVSDIDDAAAAADGQEMGADAGQDVRARRKRRWHRRLEASSLCEVVSALNVSATADGEEVGGGEGDGAGGEYETVADVMWRTFNRDVEWM